MHRSRCLLAFLPLSLGLALTGACSNELSGEIKVDGKEFKLSSCRSGQVYGFVGVELRSKEDAKLRFQQTPTGEALGYYLPPGKDTGVELGSCGTFSVSQQNSTINDVKNVEGKGEVSCSGGGHTVKGSFTYSNCH